jgi:hypothetical protein
MYLARASASTSPMFPDWSNRRRIPELHSYCSSARDYTRSSTSLILCAGNAPLDSELKCEGEMPKRPPQVVGGMLVLIGVLTMVYLIVPENLILSQLSKFLSKKDAMALSYLFGLMMTIVGALVLASGRLSR